MSNHTAEQPPSDTSAITTPNQLNSLQQSPTTTNTTTEIIAKGISAMITSVITDFDSKAAATSQSQHRLLSSLDRLTSELDQLLEDAPLPFIMQHAAKLTTVRKRVNSLNSVLRGIQRRIDNIDRMLSVGIANDQTNVGGSE